MRARFLQPFQYRHSRLVEDARHRHDANVGHRKLGCPYSLSASRTVLPPEKQMARSMAGLVHAAVEPTSRGVRGEGNYIRINALDAENIVRQLLYQRRAFLNQRVSHANEVRSLAQRSSTAAKESRN